MATPALGITYTFFSHCQRGAIVGSGTPDTLTAGTTTTLQARVTPDIALQLAPLLGGSDGTPAATVTSPVAIPAPVQLYGPGDVVGLDTRHVIRTDPANLTANFEPNYLPGVEFDDPGLPWMFTPAVPTNGAHQYISASGAVGSATDPRLRPWLALVVLADGEFALGSDAAHPSITGIQADSLPDLGESWAWAHVQVVGAMNGSTLDDILANQPAALRSRIMCPRNLEADTHYTAFLVPAFDAGVQAALGTAPTPPSSTVGPAWTASDTNITLPYFYTFEFTTSDAGDFETLVRSLQPRTLTGVGTRPMATDIPDAYWGTQSPTSGTADLGLEGALSDAGSVTSPLSMLGQISSSFVSGVEALISGGPVASADPAVPDPMVVPPLYGRWQAGVSEVSPGGGWLNELNLDPRWRVAAGLGATVVVNERDELLAAAWDQLGAIQQANQLLRQAQLSRGSLRQAFNRVLLTRSNSALLGLTAPVQTQVYGSPPVEGTTESGATVAAQVSASYLPPALLSPQARRLFRARGPIARTTQTTIGATSAKVTVSTLVNRVALSRQPFTGYARYLAASSKPAVFPTFAPLTPSTLSSLADALTSALSPTDTIPKAALAQITSMPPNWQPSDPVEPIMAAPVIDTPMSAPLAALDQRYFLPGIDSIPPETVGALETNTAFREGYMVGLNHEMNRQLLWHRYPTDQRATYFRQFWPDQGYVPAGAGACAHAGAALRHTSDQPVVPVKRVGLQPKPKQRDPG